MTIKRSSLPVFIALAAIILLGSFFRAWKLDTNPKSALIDEAHFGYLAYSLLETGKDEHGISWPLLFKGFGDQKLPLYAYSLLPWIKLLGLSVLTIRIPSLLAGIALIPASYWLVYEGFRSRKAAVVAALITAFSPWPFFLSRFGFEANLSLFFYTCGLALSLRFLKKPSLVLGLLSGLLLAITWYGYIAFRPTSLMIVASITAVGLWKKIFTGKQLAVFLVAFFLTVLPWFLPGVSQSNGARFSQIGLVHDPGLAMEIDEQRAFCADNLPKFICYGAFNKPILISKILIERYLNAFSSNYLVTQGEYQTYLTLDRFGQFAPVLYLLFLSGLIVLFTIKKQNFPVRIICIIGLLTGLLPSILAGDPQKVRLTPWYPFILLTMTAGFYWLSKFSYKNWGRLVITGTASFLLIHFCIFATQFFSVHFAKHDAWYQNYVPEITTYINSLNSEELVVTKTFYSDPLMFHAFYSKTDPKYFQTNAKLGPYEPSGFQHTQRLGNLVAKMTEVTAVACMAADEGKDQAVFITNDNIPQLKRIYEIKSTNGVHVQAFAFIVPAHMCIVEK